MKHKHLYTLVITVERILPELGTPEIYVECDCGHRLFAYEFLKIINDKAEAESLLEEREME